MDVPFPCGNDDCPNRNQICKACGIQNEANDILCKLCSLSHEMCFGGASDSDDPDDFKPEKQIAQVGRVSFDPNSSQVVGWDSIWAIIDGEE